MSHVAVSPRRTRLPFFYGWVLVGVAFVTMAVGVNARTAFSLLFPPILGEFGWDRGVTAGAFSFGFLVSAVITRALAGSWTAAVRSSSSRPEWSQWGPGCCSRPWCGSRGSFT